MSVPCPRQVTPWIDKRRIDKRTIDNRRIEDRAGWAEDVALTLVDRVCPKCSFNQPRRLARTSWIERKLMPWFGFYPWECPLCRVHFYRKNRVDREERMRAESQTEFGSGEMIQ